MLSKSEFQKQLADYAKDIKKRTPSKLNLESLVAAAKTGDGSATETIVLACQPLITSIVSKYVSSGLNLYFDDPLELVNEASIVVIERIQKYDPQKEASFKTYVYWWIEAKIKRLLAQAVTRSSREILSDERPID